MWERGGELREGVAGSAGKRAEWREAPLYYAAVLEPMRASESLRSLDAPDMGGLYVRPSSSVFRLLPSSYLVITLPFEDALTVFV